VTALYIDHIGIIVDDLDQSVSLFERLFGVQPDSLREMPEVGLRIAHIKAKNVDIELIQYLSQEEGVAREAMGSRPGMNHISLRVDDVETWSRDLQDQGARLVNGFPRQGSHGRVAFFEPESTQGILFEICERS
jgi:methylmalonyl-CoA epimerase